jgi:glycine cleavage system H protein
MNTPPELRYAASHEWVRQETDGTVTVGITDFAQDQLGDVVFVELPPIGRTVAAGDQVAVVESVKTASDIYAPVSGVITAVNQTLDGRPEAINTGPYAEGWLFRLNPSETGEIAGLLDAAGYAASVEE